jgi:putative zinc finger/helix-turn-helix YgiT family protein
MKKTMRKHDRPAPRGRALPDDACPACGTMMKEARGRLKLPINGEEIAVPSASHLKCPRCGEIVLRFQDAKRLHEDAVEIYRRKHGLLSANEIRAIRERFELNQAELADLLRLGANTVSRWESGKNVQIAAMDTLLRMIRDLPGSIDYLRPRRLKAAAPKLKSRGPRATKIAS